MPDAIRDGWDAEGRDEPPCPFVRAPWLTNPPARATWDTESSAPSLPTANEECYACGQRLWQHDMVTR